MTTDGNIVPGTLDDEINFIVHANEIEAASSGAGIYWPDVSLTVIQSLIDEINKDKTLKMRLMDRFPNSIYERLGEYVLTRYRRRALTLSSLVT